MLYTTTTSIADALGVSSATVARWLRDGMIPGARVVANKWAVPIDQAEAFVGERLDEAESDLDTGDEDEGYVDAEEVPDEWDEYDEGEQDDD